jgi:hypothetical protein
MNIVENIKTCPQVSDLSLAGLRGYITKRVTDWLAKPPQRKLKLLPTDWTEEHATKLKGFVSKLLSDNGLGMGGVR